MKKRKVWFNGVKIDEKDAKVSIYDSAMMFGDTQFTMLRSFNRELFKLEEHIDRLYNGIKIMRIPLKQTKDKMFDEVLKVVDYHNDVFDKDDEHRILINVTRGILSIYGEISPPGVPNVIIADFPLKWTTRGMGRYFDEGINMAITSQRAIPSQYLDPKIKNRSRQHYQLANIEASLFKGENWALLLDDQGYVAEGTGDNVFIVKDGTIYSPVGKNILRGISRNYIRDLSQRIRPFNTEEFDYRQLLSYQYEEKNFEPYDIYTADECFISGTPFCLLPVVSLNGINIGNGKPGPVYNSLLNCWSIEQKVDIKKQIQNWDKKIKELDGPSPYKFK